MPDAAPLMLAIECSNPALGAGVAVGRRASGGPPAVLGEVGLPPGRAAGEELMIAIDRVCRMAGCEPVSLGAVAVSVGPGGYSGTRIAVATAKAIAETAGGLTGSAPACLAVPTARVAWVGVPPACGWPRPVTVALAWKRDSAWVTRYAPDGAGAEGALLGVGEIGLRDGDTLVAEAALAERLDVPEGVVVAEPTLGAGSVLDGRCLEVAAEVDPVALAPLYPREPEAVTKWRARPRS